MLKSNSTKVYINILPLVIIFLLIGGAGYLLFGQDINLSSKDKVTKITRIEGFPHRVNVTDRREKIRRIITSEEKLTSFMTEVDPEGQIDLRENFNFNKNILIAASTDTLSGELNKFKIKRVVKEDKKRKLTIEMEQISAMEECPEKETDEDKEKKSIIVDLIQLNKTDWKIDFDTLKKKLPCGEF